MSDLTERDRVEQYVRTHPDAGVNEVLGAVGIAPDRVELVEEIIGVDTDADADGENGKSQRCENKPREPTGGVWFDADYTDIDRAYPTGHTEHDSWMVHFSGDKQPYAPWSDTDAPAPCSKHNTTADKCECDARYKWGWAKNRRAYDDAKMMLEDPRFEGLVYIQTEDDPFLFVDGDDVRCPQSRDVHPAFKAFLEHFGSTFADVSTSGSGLHAVYRGTLPEGKTTVEWEIDTEPWGENDALPAIEIYSGKHVIVSTGQHISTTPTAVNRWNAEVAYQTIRNNTDIGDTPSMPEYDGQEATQTNGRNDRDKDSDGELEDCFRALKRLDARRVAEQTIVKEWTDRSGSRHAFLPVWGSSNDGGTANIACSNFWTDTGKQSGHGGPVEMALIDLNELRHTDSRIGKAEGADFWTGYEHLRDKGFSLPEPPHKRSEEDHQQSGYYDAQLGDHTDGDPWSDPNAMLEACLSARSSGAVDRDTDPPALALQPIVRDLLGVDTVSEATRESAIEIYHEELGEEDFDGETVLL